MPDRLRLSLLSWNIHSCIGTDRRFDPARVAHFLKRVNADVVALQEVGWHHRGQVGFDQFAFLERETGYRVHAGLTKNHAGAHYGNALLTRLPLVSLDRHDIGQPFRIPRGAIEAVVDAHGQPLRVINVHLGLDPWERRQQIEQMLPALDAKGELPTILLGDTNEWRNDSPPLRDLQRRLPHVAAPQSFHTRLPRLRYDRIFLSETLSFDDFDALRTHEAGRASDHLPVYARVRLPWLPGDEKTADMPKAAAEGRR